MHGTFVLAEAVPTKPATPVFGPRWHSRSRLDIRPVLWSLRNRPEEWQQGEYTLIHAPSKHGTTEAADARRRVGGSDWAIPVGIN